MAKKIGVLIFPGTNCENETVRSLTIAGAKPEIIRWNDDKAQFKNYDGFIIPGGFSYEDRGRSGVVAAKDPVMNKIEKEALKGKPVLGICNGAQILVESGFIPGLQFRRLEMALTYNERTYKGKIMGTGFYNDWINIKADAPKNRSAFNRFSTKKIMRIPIAHGEGRFHTADEKMLEKLIKNNQTLFRYCDDHGKYDQNFPVNPNGTTYNLAGVCNLEGNILALMPHPERTSNGQPVIDSMVDYLSERGKLKPVIKTKQNTPEKIKLHHHTHQPEIKIHVKMIITDNEERTIESAAKKIGFPDAMLHKEQYYSIWVSKKKDLLDIATKIIRSGELVNLNKEIPTIIIDKKVYGYDKNTGLFAKKHKALGNAQYYVVESGNYGGKNAFNKLKPYFTKETIAKIEKGVFWAIKMKRKTQINKLLQSHLLHNPHATQLLAC
ncbi:phosphoribosylformylglycinamidine synthase I [Candidatus Peregrinibacteria bacterium]|nr:phosphoribosylformylglycinamidine synthase I [Candidatus Peregrinibacteria bacterium]